MSSKVKPRDRRNNNNIDPRFFQEEGLINKNESRRGKRDKRNQGGQEWKRERESN